MNIYRPPLFALINTVVDDTECPTATHSSAAMNYDLLVGRCGLSRRGFSDSEDEIEDGLTAGGNTVVRPRQELEVLDGPLFTLCVCERERERERERECVCV